jgi:hypothetical protein
METFICYTTDNVHIILLAHFMTHDFTHDFTHDTRLLTHDTRHTTYRDTRKSRWFSKRAARHVNTSISVLFRSDLTR